MQWTPLFDSIHGSRDAVGGSMKIIAVVQAKQKRNHPIALALTGIHLL